MCAAVEEKRRFSLAVARHLRRPVFRNSCQYSGLPWSSNGRPNSYVTAWFNVVERIRRRIDQGNRIAFRKLRADVIGNSPRVVVVVLDKRCRDFVAQWPKRLEFNLDMVPRLSFLDSGLRVVWCGARLRV